MIVSTDILPSRTPGVHLPLLESAEFVAIRMSEATTKTPVTWICPLCERQLRGKFTINSHRRNLYRKDDDPHRCDNGLGETDEYTDLPAVVQKFYNPECNVDSPPVIVAPETPAPPTPLSALARRKKTSSVAEYYLRSTSYTLISTEVPPNMMPRNMLEVQSQWHQHLRSTRSCASDTFWSFFLHIHTQSATAVDSALRAAKQTFMRAQKGTQPWKLFPAKKAILMSSLPKTFWPNVTHTARIDMSSFNLPKKVSHVTFKFIDPLFGWLMAARRQEPDELHWKPVPVTTSRGDPLYGGGVQSGRAFAEACRSCPEGTYPMCFSLHWDGTGARGLSATPICIGVANTNSCDVSTQFCLGYMPKLPGMGKEFYKSAISTTIKFYLRQQAVASILRVLEAAAKSGAICLIRNCKGVDVSLILVPRLLSMPMDQPEAQLFFGMSNRTSCSKCRRRKGYSAFRRGSFQRRSHLKILYDILEDSVPLHKTYAFEKLTRRGFNPTRRCCLLDEGDKLYVRVPKVTGGVEVYPCGDFRDRMHAMVIFMHKCIVESLNQIRWPTIRGVSQKTILDQRLCQVTSWKCLRDPETGTGFKGGQTIFGTAETSAKEKQSCLFLLPHVLGHDASMVPADVRPSLLTAIARTQLLLIASSGLRQYTTAELCRIFDEGYKLVFTSLEHIHTLYHDRKYAAALKKHLARPDIAPRPVRFKRKTRFIILSVRLNILSIQTIFFNCTGKCILSVQTIFFNCTGKYLLSAQIIIFGCCFHRDWDKHETPSTDTDDTSQEYNIGGLGKYSHGHFSLTHQHWVMQVTSGGSFRVHDTQAAEAYHKLCMHLPAERVRHSSHYHTSVAMLKYLLNRMVFNEIKEVVIPTSSRPRTPAPGVRKPLHFLWSDRVCTVTMGRNLSSVKMQQRILHEEVRIARVELLDMLCQKFNMPHTTSSYTALEQLDWVFGQKLIMPDGRIFWGTDSSYTWYTDETTRRRRDCLILDGKESIPVTLPNGDVELRDTALCCQSICFIKLGNMFALQDVSLPYDIECEIVADTLTLALVRWFEPHPTATERDDQNLPICPGILSINHCLWRWAISPGVRSALCDDDGQPTPCFNSQKYMFGKTLAQQHKCLERESHAYYDLVKPSSIKSLSYMSPAFEHNTLTPTHVWLQTVTLI